MQHDYLQERGIHVVLTVTDQGWTVVIETYCSRESEYDHWKFSVVERVYVQELKATAISLMLRASLWC